MQGGAWRGKIAYELRPLMLFTTAHPSLSYRPNGCAIPLASLSEDSESPVNDPAVYPPFLPYLDN